MEPVAEVDTPLQMHRAARQGDLETLQRLVDAGVDIDARAEVEDVEPDRGSQLQQLTPLMTAARSIDGAGTETLAWLMEHGADLHAVSRGNVTAAWYAAGKGGRWEWHPWKLVPHHAECLRLLLDAGLDPNETSCTGRSLLAEACFAGDPATVALLRERGASLEPAPSWVDEGNDFRTCSHRDPAPLAEGAFYNDQIPLFGAVASGSLACVELLLAHPGGAPHLDRIDEYGYDALDRALSKEDYLWSVAPGPTKGSLMRFPPQGPDPRYFAIAQRLLEAGVPLERVEGDGQSRLWNAAFRSQEGAVTFLLERGADPNEANDRGETPLHAICWHGSSTALQTEVWQRIIRRLVAAGASLEARLEGSPSALGMAIYGDVPCPESVATLLELGADPNARDERGRTPLHYAVKGGYIGCAPSIIAQLLAHGGDLWCKDDKGVTPLDAARAEVVKREKDVERNRASASSSEFLVSVREVLALLEASADSISTS